MNKYSRRNLARGSLYHPDRTGPRFYTPQKAREERTREDQAHDPAHGADAHAAWVQLREADAWVDP
jgi:hypothetical protein